MLPTTYPAEVTFPPLPQSKLVLDLATPEGCLYHPTGRYTFKVGHAWIILAVINRRKAGH